MGKSSSFLSMEIGMGIALIVLGLVALMMGWHGLLAEALAPFGVGIILSDVLTRAGRAARQSVRVLVRRDDD